MKRILWVILAALLSAAALAGPTTQPVIQAADFASPPADPVAKVNGQPIAREQMTQLLLQGYGKKMLKVVISLEVVRQQAKAKGVTVTPADLDDEEARSFPDELKKMSVADRGRLLDDYLERNGFTRVDWKLFIERQAYLRKLCSNVPEPDERLLREMFNRRYGERVEVRCIEVNSWAEMAKVKKRLEGKEPFESVARELSVNKRTAANDGKLEPFDAKDPNVPEDIRAAAFMLKTPGDRSDEINYNGRIHLLQLVGRIPPDDVKFENVRDKLAAQVREVQVRQQMEFSLRTILTAADIEVLDPVLREQVEKDKLLLPPGTTRPAGGAPRGP